MLNHFMSILKSLLCPKHPVSAIVACVCGSYFLTSALGPCLCVFSVGRDNSAPLRQTPRTTSDCTAQKYAVNSRVQLASNYTAQNYTSHQRLPVTAELRRSVHQGLWVTASPKLHFQPRTASNCTAKNCTSNSGLL